MNPVVPAERSRVSVKAPKGHAKLIGRFFSTAFLKMSRVTKMTLVVSGGRERLAARSDAYVMPGRSACRR